MSKEHIIPIEIEGRDLPMDSAMISEDEDPIEESSDEEIIVEKSWPLSNSKERIIIVLDTAEDDNVTPFKLSNGPYQPLEMVKRAIEQFVNLKHSINNQHEFALVVMDDSSAHWEVDFSSNPKCVLSRLDKLQTCEAEDTFDLSTLFHVIRKNVTLPQELEVEDTMIPPPYLVRVILFYGRSYTVPILLKKNSEINALLTSPFFIVDVLMTHEPPDVANNCNKIFDVLQNVDVKGFAYFFNVARDATTLFASIGKLLGHPLQRPIQNLANYSIKP